MNHQPPEWILRFITFYSPPHLAEGIIGDIWEEYEEMAAERGIFRARSKLLWNALRFIRPGIIFRNVKTHLLINTSMFKINLLLAMRNMMKNKFYTLINLAGLSLGIAFVLLVFLYVQNALQHDLFHQDAERIFRLNNKVEDANTGEQLSLGASTPIPFSKDLAEQFPEIESYTRVIKIGAIVDHEDHQYQEEVMMVDAGFFDMFSFPVEAGNPRALLTGPRDVVLSPEYALKYFGYNDPIGKELEIIITDVPIRFRVTGVVNPLKEVSSIPFDLLVDCERIRIDGVFPERFLDDYHVSALESYVKLNKGVDPPLAAVGFTDFFRGRRGKEERELSFIELQPLTDIYLNDAVSEQNGSEVSSPIYAYILGGLGVLVLVIATMNFIMLNSSLALNRIKEFGVRKTMGAFKFQLFAQVAFESFFLAFVASLVALGLTFLVLPFFSDLAGKALTFSLSLPLVVFLIVLIVAIAMITGLLSSGFLIRVEVARALKGEVKAGKNSWVRSAMVIAQFSMSIGLIIGTLVFRSQMKYVSRKSLGYDKGHLLEVSTQNVSTKEQGEKIYRQFKSLAESKPEIESVAAVMNDMEHAWTTFFFEEEQRTYKPHFNLVSTDYVATMGMEIVNGRDFHEGETKSHILVNETLVKEFDLEDPIGKQVPGGYFTMPHQIIGVVKDFHFSSLHQKIEPLILALDEEALMSGRMGMSSESWPPAFYQLVVKSTTDDFQLVSATLEEIWYQVQPDRPFQLQFYDTILNNKYEEEHRYSRIIDYAALFSLIIAWLGLMGLTRLTVQKRLKEVGIRKVLGSTSMDITLLISKRFMLLVGAANLVAWPLAWYGLNEWLSNFAYKIDLNYWLFILAGLLVLGVTFISVSFQTVKASLINPVKTLRSE